MSKIFRNTPFKISSPPRIGALILGISIISNTLIACQPKYVQEITMKDAVCLYLVQRLISEVTVPIDIYSPVYRKCIELADFAIELEKSFHVKDVVISEFTSENKHANDVIIPVNNCNNPSETGIDQTIEYTIERKFELGGDLTLGMERVLIARLQTHFGFQNKTTVKNTNTIHLKASPNGFYKYHITWWHTVDRGEITVLFNDGSNKKFSYTVIASAMPEISEVEQVSCP